MANQRRFPVPVGYFPSNVGTYTSTQLVASTWLALGLVSEQAKTLGTVRVFCSALAGTVANTDIICEVFSDSSATPGSSLGSTSTVSGAWTAGGWNEFSGLSVALTAGAQYWLVFRNNNGTPATNNITIKVAGANQVWPGGHWGNSTKYGTALRVSTNAGSSWGTAAVYTGGVRVGFSDSSYDGIPVSAGGTTGNYVYAGRKCGAAFSANSGAALQARGVTAAVSLIGTPTGAAFFELYQGTTLIGTTHTVGSSSANVGSANAQYVTAYFPSTISLVGGTAYRVVLAETTQSDASSNRYLLWQTTFDGDSNSLPLRPEGGTWCETYYNGSTWTDTATSLPTIALLLDTYGEAAGGSYATAANVRNGVDRGDGVGGTLVVPAAGSVLSTVTFDNGTSGTLILPGMGDVRTGVNRGDGTLGILTVPTAGQVLAGVTFDGGTAGTVALAAAGNVRTGINRGDGVTGTLTLPAAGSVQDGVQYGAGGTEFTGSLTTTGISLGDLQAELDGRDLSAALVTTAVGTALSAAHGAGAWGGILDLGATAPDGWLTPDACSAPLPADVRTVAGEAATVVTTALQVDVIKLDGEPVTAPAGGIVFGPEVDTTNVSSSGSGPPLDGGTARGGGPQSIILAVTAPGLELAPNCYVGIAEGTGSGQWARITAYDQVSKVAEVDTPWLIEPDETSVYGIQWAGDYRTVLTPTGLDAVPITEVTGRATTFAGRLNQVWRSLYNRSKKDAAAGTITRYLDNGTTPASVQPFSDDGAGTLTIHPVP